MEQIILDIETIEPTASDLELELSLIKPAGNIKDQAKIEKNLEQKQAAATEKQALLHSAPVHTIGMIDGGRLIVLSCCKLSTDELVALEAARVTCKLYETEPELLSGFDEEIGNREIQFITFNGKRFDLPKLRFRHAVNNQQMPASLICNSHIDLMCEYLYKLTDGSIPFISMSEVVQKLHISSGKTVSGKHYPELIKTGQHLTAILYNIIDLLLTVQIKQRIGV